MPARLPKSDKDSKGMFLLITLYSDDASGNKSNKYNCFNSIPLMLAGFSRSDKDSKGTFLLITLYSDDASGNKYNCFNSIPLMLAGFSRSDKDSKGMFLLITLYSDDTRRNRSNKYNCFNSTALMLAGFSRSKKTRKLCAYQLHSTVMMPLCLPITLYSDGALGNQIPKIQLLQFYSPNVG